ncbi:uncharacterized protein DC041_0011336 [Schistosoma bovis]|uniref:L27 domain-containing protein n=1 Tax=Schistosoma bovis TaxID=6184 RepID=A0A430Q768_SCHBO|nr:uncharacterized protein DC041_0011336 [Schistosoma bovis]
MSYGLLKYFKTINTVHVQKSDAHLALNQITNYRNRLDNEKDGLLVQALNRLMNVFQSRLFLGLLDIQEFYEAVLLDPQKTKEEKTSAALEIASRWENISSPSLVASTTDLRIPHSLLKKTDCFDRAVSMTVLTYFLITFLKRSFYRFVHIL